MGGDFIFTWDVLRYLAPYHELKDNILYHWAQYTTEGGVIVFNDDVIIPKITPPITSIR